MLLLPDIMEQSQLKQISWLTVNMLNCFEGYKRCTCIHISSDILDFVQQKTRITMDNGIDQISRNIPSLASEELP